MEFQSFSVATMAHGAGVVFSREERQRHVYIIGKSRSGKSTFLFNLVMGDIHAGEGVAVIDPHGDPAEDILDAIPRSRINEVCYLDAGETEYPVGFNPATRIAPERRALAASGIVSAFKHLWLAGLRAKATVKVVPGCAATRRASIARPVSRACRASGYERAVGVLHCLDHTVAHHENALADGQVGNGCKTHFISGGGQ
jgi:hypothetical protein